MDGHIPQKPDKNNITSEFFLLLLYNLTMDFDLIEDLKKADISFKQDEPISAKTTFKVGGKVSLFIQPAAPDQLQKAVEILQNHKSRFFLLGGGSNLVFPDSDFECPVISTEKLNSVFIENTQNIENSAPDFAANKIPTDKVLVTCLAGTPMATFVNFCTKNNLSGAEEFAGLPGSIGGALFMNARCFDKSICELIYSTQHLEYANPSENKNNQNFIPKIVNSFFKAQEWDYKKSPFQKQNKIITQATFLLTKKTPQEHDEIENKCKFFINERVSKGHFKYPSAGSVFKNNHAFGKPSGKLIDDAGLKGYAIGGAQIAPFHGNFIINTDHAKACDIKELVIHAQKIVQQKFGFMLEPEIIFVDDFSK